MSRLDLWTMFRWVCAMAVAIAIYLYVYDMMYGMMYEYDVCHVCESNMCFCWLFRSHGIQIRGSFRNKNEIKIKRS